MLLDGNTEISKEQFKDILGKVDKGERGGARLVCSGLMSVLLAS